MDLRWNFTIWAWLTTSTSLLEPKSTVTTLLDEVLRGMLLKTLEKIDQKRSIVKLFVFTDGACLVSPEKKLFTTLPSARYTLNTRHVWLAVNEIKIIFYSSIRCSALPFLAIHSWIFLSLYSQRLKVDRKGLLRVFGRYPWYIIGWPH